jgi:hypothetical protein
MRLKPSIDNHKYSYRLPVTCDYVCKALGITELTFNRSLSLLTEKRMPTRSALEHCGISRSNLVALHKYFSTEKVFRNYLVESLGKKNGMSRDIGKFDGFIEEEENSSFEEKLLYALNRRAASKLRKVSSGTAFNIKRANCVHFEKIPDGQPIKRLIFFHVYWYNPQTQKVMKAKSALMSSIKELYKPYYTEEEMAERLRRQYSKAAGDAAYIMSTRIEKAEAEKRAKEAVLERRRQAKEKKRKKREELEAWYKKLALERLVSCEKNKWAARVQYLHWRFKEKLIKALHKARKMVKARRQILVDIREKVERVPPVKMPNKYERKEPYNIFDILNTDDVPGIRYAPVDEDEVKVEQEVVKSKAAPKRPEKPKPKKLEGEEALLRSINLMRSRYNAREDKSVFFKERRNLGGGKAVVDDETRKKRLLETWEDVLLQGSEDWVRDTLLYSSCSREQADEITKEVSSRKQ